MFRLPPPAVARTVVSVFLIATSALAAPRTNNDNRRPFIGKGATIPRAQQFECLPLERSGQNHLLVRASINGKRALLLVDTGAPISIIALDRVRYFAMSPARADSEYPARLQVNNGSSYVAVAHSLLLGSLNLIDEPMVAMDLRSTRRIEEMMNEEAADGIIGADILFPTNAVLDCRAQVLILKIDPSVRGNAPGLDFTGFSRVPIQVSAGYNLYVNGKFNGKRARLLIDTGAFGTLMHQQFVRQMKIPLRKTAFGSDGLNFDGGGIRLATISRFTIGSVDMKSKEVGVIDLESLFGAALLTGIPPVAGLLGSEILAQHNAIIDFGSRTLYLRQEPP